MTAQFEAANRIAILILTRNHEEYIDACLQSIPHSGLKGWHTWVLDDGSTDATRDVVRAYARSNPNTTLLIQSHNGGITSQSSQRLIDESSGEYVVLMSGDDLFGHSSGIARSVAAMDCDPRLALVIPRMVYLIQDPSRGAPECHGIDLLSTLRSGDAGEVLQRHLYKSVSRIFLQGMVIRRSIIEKFGGFDTEILADDYAFVMRLFSYLHDSGHSFIFDESNIWLYRVHDANVHRDPVRQFTLIAEVVKKYVLPYARGNFRWDAMIIENDAQWVKVRQRALQILGYPESVRALRPAISATIRAAARRGDMRLLWKILLGKGVDILHRTMVVLHLPKAMARKLVAWRRRQCRLRN